MLKQTQTILLLGSSGFIGQRVTEKLQSLGYQLRTPNREQIDFIAPNQQKIAQLLKGVDVIINMVGVMSPNTALLEQVHHTAPVQIAMMAKQLGVKRWVNLSALGADAQHKVAFVGSKGLGDQALLQLADRCFSVLIARPALVFGRGGTSCEMFIKLARLPMILLPNKGNYKIQPVHIEDVAQGLVNLAVNYSQELPVQINFTGGAVCTLAQYLGKMRQEIHHLTKPTILSLPNSLSKVGAVVAKPLSGGLISPDSLTLLEEGSVADNQAFTQLLGYPPLGYKAFLASYL